MSNPQIFQFTPPPVIDRFMQDDVSIARFLMGPVGSGKTTGCIYELLRRCAEQSPDPRDGRRRTRWAIVRNTLQQIKTTVLKDIQEILTGIVQFKVSESTIYVNAGEVYSEWLLIPLDTVEDQRRLLSTQLTGAYVNEWREVSPDLVSALIGRLGRYPSKMVGGPSWHGLIADSNPGTQDSPWYEKLELDLPDNWGFYKQPSGLSPEAENVENLPDGYYDNLMQGADKDWIEGHVHGEWMPSLAGTAVFRASFDPEEHITNDAIRTTPGSPVCVGLDLGRTPTAIVGQLDWKGRLVIFDELLGKDTGLEQFLRTELTPLLMQDKYARCPVYICFDPAGMAKSQLTEHNALDIIKRHRFVGVPAPTNDITQRLDAVRYYMLQRDGFLIDARCRSLIQALKFHYKFKRKRDGDLTDVPDKNHPWSDIADALQYLCLGMNERIQGRAMTQTMSAKDKSYAPPKMPTGAWT